MTRFECFLNKENKKISYPELAVIEPLFGAPLRALALFTPEIKSGELIIVEYFNNQIERIFKSENENIEQIYGLPNLVPENAVLKLAFLNKKKKIEEYIADIYRSLSVNDLIAFKHDLNDFEKELIKYFLLCKTENKVNYKNLRSVVFKNCKNNKLAETICFYLKNKPFRHFGYDTTIVRVDFESLTVQFGYD
jgi:hypothetical protein